ncbi:GLPGLI family protein [Bergeyella sp. RCAD1439]|uniref:GLPGLI family protein n=1 Tax=Bergeyella anatis TaxID=3113737 RepID=UPI002E18894A|nr:GLPGLI family protein [Bergeyella sp. RCAD1439]
MGSSVVYPTNTIDSIANKPRFIYFNNKTRLFYSNIINDDIETILFDNSTVRWTLTSEKKKILNFKCQKAIGEYHGKEYIVWYTEQLPNPYGPFKINGLKGVILEVSTADNQMHLIAEKVSDTTDENKIDFFISKYDLSKSISKEDYQNILDQRLKEFEDKINVAPPEGKKIRFNKNCIDCNKSNS